MNKSPMLSATPAVLDAVDGELAYINVLDRMTADNGVAGQLVTLRTLIQQAEYAWYSLAGDDAALDVVRKIAAAAIRALLLYGCPERAIPADDEELKLMWKAEFGSPKDRAAARAAYVDYRASRAIDDAVTRIESSGFTVDRKALEAIVQPKLRVVHADREA